MLPGDICNHIDFVFSEILRFYLSQLLIADGIDHYDSNDKKYNEYLNTIIEKIKKTINSDMNDILELYKEQYLKKREFLKHIDIID